MKYRLEYGDPRKCPSWDQCNPDPYIGWQECTIVFDAQSDEEAVGRAGKIITDKVITFEERRYHASIIRLVEERPVSGWEPLNKIGSDAPNFASNGEVEIKALAEVRELIQRQQQS